MARRGGGGGHSLRLSLALGAQPCLSPACETKGSENEPENRSGPLLLEVHSEANHSPWSRHPKPWSNRTNCETGAQVKKVVMLTCFCNYRIFWHDHSTAVLARACSSSTRGLKAAVEGVAFVESPGQDLCGRVFAGSVDRICW